MKQACLFLIFSLIHFASFAQWVIQNEAEQGDLYYSRKIKFRNDSVGFVFSDNKVLTTINSGADWSESTLPIDMTVMGFQFIDDTTIVATGYEYVEDQNGGRVLISGDNGKTWQIRHLKSYELYDQWFFNCDTGIVVGFQGIHKTYDGGKSWFKTWESNLPEDDRFRILSSIYDVEFVNDSIGYAIGSDYPDGILLKTVDSGSNWSVIKTFDRKRDFASLFCFNADTLIVGLWDVIYKTDDGGKTWSTDTILHGHGQLIQEFDFISDEVGYVLSREPEEAIPLRSTQFYQISAISKTTDGGQSWESYILPGLMYSLDFLSEDTGYVVGMDELILSISGGDLDSIPGNYPFRTITSINSDNDLLTVFPNPSEDQLFVESSFLIDSKAIRLVSMDGRLITTDIQNVNPKKWRIDVSELQSGVYLLVIRDKVIQKSLRVIKL